MSYFREHPESPREVNEYYGQVTYEKGFKSKAEAEAWTAEQATKLELSGEVYDSISRNVWGPAS